MKIILINSRGSVSPTETQWSELLHNTNHKYIHNEVSVQTYHQVEFPRGLGAESASEYFLLNRQQK